MNSESRRAANFTEKEVEQLLALVKKYKHVVESKVTDAVMWKEKEQCWQRISNEFNALTGQTPRSAKNIKMKYENLKKTSKKKFANERSQIFKTGGGTFTPTNVTSTDIEIKKLLGVGVTGLHNQFDDDALQNEFENDSLQQEEILTIEVEEPDQVGINSISICVPSPSPLLSDIQTEPITPTHEASKWNTWHPTHLKRPRSRELNFQASDSRISQNDVNENVKKGKHLAKKKNELTNDCRLKINALSEAKLELIKLQTDVVRQDIDRKRKQDLEESSEAKQELFSLQKESLRQDIILKEQNIRHNEEEFNFKRIEHELRCEEIKKKIRMLDKKSNS